MGGLAPRNRAYSLYGAFFGQESVCEVNESVWMATRASKFQEHGFPQKTHWLFGMHRTSYSLMRTLAP